MLTLELMRYYRLTQQSSLLRATKTFLTSLERQGGKDLDLRLVMFTQKGWRLFKSSSSFYGSSVLEIVNNGNYVTYLNSKWTEAITEALGFDRHTDVKDVPWIAAKIHELYFSGENITAESLLNMTNLFTDYSFYYGIKEAMLHHVKNGAQVYPYMFSYKGNFSLTGIPTEGTKNDCCLIHASMYRTAFHKRTPCKLQNNFEEYVGSNILPRSSTC